jgi:sec-independent protein translocase protein TatA
MLVADIFGTTDVVVILVVLLLIFGGRKLPGLARSLGSATSEFKKGVEEGAQPKQQSETTDTDTTGTDKQ